MEMPTIAELKARLKSMGVKGYAKKNKTELMAMLEGSPVPARDRTPVAMSPRGASALATALNRVLGRGTGGAPPLSDAVSKLREVEAATKGRNEARAAAAKAKAPVAAGGAGGPPPKAKAAPTQVPEALRAKLRKDKFLLKAYNDVKGIDEFVESIDEVLKGKGTRIPSEDRSYGAKVYDLGEFYSMKWPKNANNVNIPKATDKLISQIPGGEYSIRVHTTGDTEAYGRYEDVIMILLKNKTK